MNGGADMWFDFAIALIFAALLVLIAWGFKGRLLTPVVSGENTHITLEVEVDGVEPCVEHTLKSLVWLHESGTLSADIVLHISAEDTTTRHIAETYAAKYNFIKCCYGDNLWKSSLN